MKSITTLLALSLPLLFFSCTTTKYSYVEHEFTEPYTDNKPQKIDLEYSIQDFILTYRVQNNTDSLYLVDWTKSVFIINDRTYHFMEPVMLRGSLDGVIVQPNEIPNLDLNGNIQLQGQKRSPSTTVPPKLAVTRSVSLHTLMRNQNIDVNSDSLELRIQSHLVVTSLDQREIIVKKIETEVSNSIPTGGRKRPSYERPDMYGYGVLAETVPDPAGNVFAVAITGLLVFWLSNVGGN
jgi:hypothetical protein